MVLLPAYRFEYVEASIHWTHVAHAIDLALTEHGGHVEVDVTVWDHADYWTVPPVARSARLGLRGRWGDAPPGLVCLVVDDSPVLRSLAFDPARAKVEYLDGPWSPGPALPDFWAPLLAWARPRW